MNPSNRMPKSLLVICSGPNGSDYPREENQVMLKKLLGDDFVPTFMGLYPEDLPTGTLFDAVFFGGCNALTWIFHDTNPEPGIRRLSSILKDDAFVIFVETKSYVIAHGEEDQYNSHGLTLPLNSIKVLPIVFNDDTGLKQGIIAKWKRYFKESTIDKYIVYKKIVRGGNKKRSITKRKRKTRSHK